MKNLIHKKYFGKFILYLTLFFENKCLASNHLYQSIYILWAIFMPISSRLISYRHIQIDCSEKIIKMKGKNHNFSISLVKFSDKNAWKWERHVNSFNLRVEKPAKVNIILLFFCVSICFIIFNNILHHFKWAIAP